MFFKIFAFENWQESTCLCVWISATQNLCNLFKKLPKDLQTKTLPTAKVFSCPVLWICENLRTPYDYVYCDIVRGTTHNLICSWQKNILRASSSWQGTTDDILCLVVWSIKKISISAYTLTYSFIKAIKHIFIHSLCCTIKHSLLLQQKETGTNIYIFSRMLAVATCLTFLSWMVRTTELNNSVGLQFVHTQSTQASLKYLHTQLTI